MTIVAREMMMGEQDEATTPQDDTPAPATVEQEGTGGEEVSGAGYGNNAGYQGEAEPDDDA